MAAAFGLRRRAVTLVAGASSRTKILEVEGADPAALSRLLAEAGSAVKRGASGVAADGPPTRWRRAGAGALTGAGVNWEPHAG